MDRQSTIVVVLCLLLLGLWSFVLVPKLYPPKPLPPGFATNHPPAAVSVTAPGATSPTVTSSSTLPSDVGGFAININSNVPEELVEITNLNAHYTFSSYGGGLKLIELLHYPETVSSRFQRGSASSRVATLNTFTRIPTLALLDGDAVEGDGIYKLTQTATGVRAEKALTNGLSVVKEFEMSTNYLVMATVRLENHSDHPLTLPPQHWFVGTATPMNPQDDGSVLGLMWWNGSKAQDTMGSSFFSERGFACTPRVPPLEYRAGQSNVFWAAVHNQFFALVVMPQDPAQEVVMRRSPLPPPNEEDALKDSRIVKRPMGYQAAIGYPGLTLSPTQTFTRQFTFFAGPKEYRTLATVAAAFRNDVDDVMGFGASGISAVFGFFSKGLLLGMNTLHNTLSLSYGAAIIVITILIKVIFWPLTQASTRSAKRMQVLQPQIKALQEKYKDDPVKAQKKTMEFWKEHKINPMSGCLPTLIQMPVFIGFFYMIRSAIELRGATFFWVSDLSRPDTLFLIPGLNFPFNLLPLIMGGTMLWQAHLTPPSPGMDPSQAKIMRYMPLMFMVFLYNFSAGLTLYWTVQNLLSIVQTKLIRTSPEPVSPVKPQVLTSSPKKRK